MLTVAPLNEPELGRVKKLQAPRAPLISIWKNRFRAASFFGTRTAW